MEDKFQKIFSEFNNIHLSEDEKNLLKNRIISEINLISLRGDLDKQRFAQKWFWYLSQPRLAVSFAALLIFVLSGGGVMAAASRAVPGDLLYPVKTEFNERLAGSFDFSTAAKATREVKLVGKRLQETQAVIATGRLSPEAIEIVESRLEKHVENIKNYVGVLKNMGENEKVAILQDQLEISLSANERILSSLEVVVGEVASVAPRAKENLASITMERSVAPEVDIEGVPNDLSETAKIKLARAEKAVDDAEILIKRQKIVNDNFGKRLSQIRGELEEGRVLFEIKSNREAIEVFDSVFRSASEIKMLLEASHKLPIRIEFSDTGSEDISVSEEGPNTGILISPVVTGSVRGEFKNLRSISTTSSLRSNFSENILKQNQGDF